MRLVAKMFGLILVTAAILFVACTSTPPTVTPSPLTGVITGELVWDVEQAYWTETLPVDGYIKLVNVTGKNWSRFTGFWVNPHGVVAEGEVMVGDNPSRSTPVEFVIEYDPTAIDPNMDYAIFVRFNTYTSAYPDSDDPEFYGHGTGEEFSNHQSLNEWNLACKPLSVCPPPTLVITKGHPEQSVQVPLYLTAWES